MFTVYLHTHEASMFNGSGLGHGRFSPCVNASGGNVPTMYLARRRTTALLETVFHEIRHVGTHHVSRDEVSNRGLRQVTLPESLRLVDLTDSRLRELVMKSGGRLSRADLVSSPASHYSCTQEWASFLHGHKIGGVQTAGILWDSRIAEIAYSTGRQLLRDFMEGDSSQVAVVFGDRLNAVTPSDFHALTYSEDLRAGDGAALVAEVVHQLGASIDP